MKKGHKIEDFADILKKTHIPFENVENYALNSGKIKRENVSHLLASITHQLSNLKSNDTKNVSIVLPDKTRPVPNKKILKHIVKTLKALGCEKTFLIIAYGNHKKHAADKLGLSSSFLNDVKIVHHDSNNFNKLLRISSCETKSRTRFKSHLKNLSRKGTPSFLDRNTFNKLKMDFLKGAGKDFFVNNTFAKSNLKIILSDIKPHQIFGYSGGTKMILPGISDKNSILTNHLMRIHKSCKLGNIKGNLARNESYEIASKLDNVLYVNTISDNRGNILHSSVSFSTNGYEKIVNKAEEIFRSKNIKRNTVVSLALHPINLNMYQMTKAITPAALSLKINGKIIIVADLKEKECDLKSLNEKIYKLTIKRELPSGCEKIYLYSNLSKKTVKKTFMLPLNRKELLELLKKDREKLLIIPNGDLIVP